MHAHHHDRIERSDPTDTVDTVDTAVRADRGAATVRRLPAPAVWVPTGGSGGVDPAAMGAALELARLRMAA